MTSPAVRLLRWFAVALSVLAVLVATLHQSGEMLAPGWTFSIASGEGALAELIQNLILFIPFGAAFAAAFPRRPFAAVFFGALLSCSVEFAQQWIPGRDPSVGDIACNTVSTLLGVALVLVAPRWLLTTPERSAWRALGTAVIAVLAWLGTAALLRPTVPGGPYRVVSAPDFEQWGLYRGEIRSARLERGMLIVEAVAPPRPPRRRTPLAAVLDPHDTRVAILAVAGNDLSLRYHMAAQRLTLQQPDLRWYGALAELRPRETFTAAMGHDPGNLCLALNRDWRCGLGFTIGDGWKLIYYPERWPRWMLTVINALWVAGCVIGVGYWAARTTTVGTTTVGATTVGTPTVGTTTVGDGRGRYETAMAKAAVAIVLIALIVVPIATELKASSLLEWIGALGGIEVGLVLGNRALQRRLL